MPLLDINQVINNLLAVAVIVGFFYLLYHRFKHGAGMKIDFGKFVGKK